MALKIKSSKEEIKSWVNENELLDYLTSTGLIDEKCILKRELDTFNYISNQAIIFQSKKYPSTDHVLKIELEKRAKSYPSVDSENMINNYEMVA